MALEPCTGCGRRISKRAARCPNCGLACPTRHRQTERDGLLYASILGAMLLILLAVLLAQLLREGSAAAPFRVAMMDRRVPEFTLAPRAMGECRESAILTQGVNGYERGTDEG